MSKSCRTSTRSICGANRSSSARRQSLLDQPACVVFDDVVGRHDLFDAVLSELQLDEVDELARGHRVQLDAGACPFIADAAAYEPDLFPAGTVAAKCLGPCIAVIDHHRLGLKPHCLHVDEP